MRSNWLLLKVIRLVFKRGTCRFLLLNLQNQEWSTTVRQLRRVLYMSINHAVLADENLLNGLVEVLIRFRLGR